MNLNVPPAARLVIYVVNVLGTPLVAYASAKGWIGDLEVSLWSAEVAAAFALAGLNVAAKV